MPVRFMQGDIKRLLRHFNMRPAQKGSYIYEGIGKDGNWRRCKFDYHKDRDQIATGTAKSIATSLLFKDCQEMKEYIDDKL